MNPPVIKTQRLFLRSWDEKDLEPFTKLNADPRVMEYFPSTLKPEESQALYQKILKHFDQYGFGVWALSLKESGQFIGFTGLVHVDFSTPFTPAVEIGWRLSFDQWGKGYATEAALAALQYGFDILNLSEIVSFTAVQNLRSRKVMEKIGMHYNPSDDFDHPKLPALHPLRRHVLYRLRNSEWRARQSSNKYIFDPYDEIFPALFQKEKTRILSQVNNVLQIEHVGSTAVPGLDGKGIIDIGILTEKDNMASVSSILQNIGYEFRPSFSTSDRLYFVAKLPDLKKGVRRYHIHLTYPDSPIWEELTGLRDYLIKHPVARNEYAKLKEKAVKAGLEGEAYRKAKEPFLKKVLKKIAEP